MRDDLSAPNLGQAKREEYDVTFFWQSYRAIEQWMTRILTKGPISVSTLTADEVIASRLVGTLTGDVVGGSFKFPATRVPSADPNTLDDYEQNSYVPGISFAGAAVDMTYSNQIGSYVLIGGRCFFNVYLTMTAKGSSVGQARLSLPFAAASPSAGGYSSLACGLYQGMALPVATFPAGYVQATTNYALLVTPSTTASYTPLMDTHFTNGSGLMFSGHYTVA